MGNNAAFLLWVLCSQSLCLPFFLKKDSHNPRSSPAYSFTGLKKIKKNITVRHDFLSPIRLRVKQRTLGSRISACLHESVCHGGKLPPTTSQMLVNVVCLCSAAEASHSGSTKKKSYFLCGEIVKMAGELCSFLSCLQWLEEQVMGSSGPHVLKEAKYQVHQTISPHQRGEICLSTARRSGKYL